MSIDFRPLTQHDDNFAKVIQLYKKAFTTVRHIPAWILRFNMRKGKNGFNALYIDNTWIGLIYSTEYNGVVLIHFLAISAALRSGGYGSKVMDSMKRMHAGKRIVLNIELLDKQEKNYSQRVKRKAFYEKNGFISSGYIVKDTSEALEMLIVGGSIRKEEIEAIYEDLLTGIFDRLLRPKIITI